jgi:hypothetical protein
VYKIRAKLLTICELEVIRRRKILSKNNSLPAGIKLGREV